MNEATAAQPDPEPPGLDLLLMQATAELGRARRALEADMEARGDLTELMYGWHRLAGFEAAIRNAALLSAAGAAAVTPVPEPEPAPRRHRHRLPAQRNAARSLRAVRGLVPAGGLAALRHSLAAHAPAAAKVALAHPLITLATGTAAAGLITTAVVVPGGPGAGPSASASSAQAGAPGWDATATPVTLPSPPQAARTATAPRLSADAASRNPLTVPAPLPPASYVPPDAPPPDSQQPQDPQQQAQDAPQVTAGTLAADVTGVDLGTGYSGTVTLRASGGPVQWGAVPSAGSLSLDARRGALADGQSVTIGITVTAAAQLLGGSATLTLWPGDIRIAVTWPALPVPASGPSPADAPSPAGS